MEPVRAFAENFRPTSGLAFTVSAENRLTGSDQHLSAGPALTVTVPGQPSMIARRGARTCLRACDQDMIDVAAHPPQPIAQRHRVQQPSRWHPPPRETLDAMAERFGGALRRERPDHSIIGSRHLATVLREDDQHYGPVYGHRKPTPRQPPPAAHRSVSVAVVVVLS